MKNESKKSFWQKLPLDDYFVFYNKVLDAPIAQRLKLRELSEKFIYQGTKNGIKAGKSLGKIFQSSAKSPDRFSNKIPDDFFDLNYTDDQTLIQESVKEFAVALRAAAQEQDEKKEISDEIWNAYNDLQLAYLQTPEALGGLSNEKSITTQMLILETLAYGDLGQAYSLYSSNAVINALVEYGSEAQQTELIPEYFKEEKLYAGIAINELQPLFNPYQLTTTAIIEDEHFILNGTKTLIPFGKKCQYFLIAAQLENGDNQLFMVDADQDGVTITDSEAMGLKSAQLSDIILNNVRVHKSAQLGEAGGIDYHRFIQMAKLGWCALAVGACQAVLDYVISYANDRVAFGEPISNRQAVAFMIADMKIELDAMRILTQRAVAQAEQGIDFMRAAYLAHVCCSDKSMQIGSNGVQLLGGHGYIKDFPVERWYRDLRAVSIMYNSIHL
ncbi:MAG: acyl-CoA dehydrogenase family protein [Chitinophagales bacterium]|nr:acyl-CoA/acyl-ACP dehydrogenase [Bacteroidota bacterium]